MAAFSFRPTPLLNQQTASPPPPPIPPVSHLRPPSPPLPHGPPAPCDRRHPTSAPSSKLSRFGAHRWQREFLGIALFGGSRGVGGGVDGICPLLQRPTHHCSKCRVIHGWSYTCLLCVRSSRSHPRLIVRTIKVSTCIRRCKRARFPTQTPQKRRYEQRTTSA